MEKPTQWGCYNERKTIKRKFKNKKFKKYKNFKKRYVKPKRRYYKRKYNPNQKQKKG